MYISNPVSCFEVPNTILTLWYQPILVADIICRFGQYS